MADAHFKQKSHRELVKTEPAAAVGAGTGAASPQAGPAEHQPGPVDANFIAAVVWAAAFVGMFVPAVLELVVGLLRK